MSKKATDIVAYIGPIGFIIAYLAGDKERSRFHLNQALVLCILEILLSVAVKVAGYIPLIGVFIRIAIGIISFALFILWVMGIASAIEGTEKELPVLGVFHLL